MSLRGALVAFDLDGTLVDTAPDLIGSLNTLLHEEGLGPVPLASARHLVGRGARALIERGFAQAGRSLDGADASRLFERFIEIYLGRIADESRPFDGVEAALDALKDAGASLAVCTNKISTLIVPLLEALELIGWFDVVIGADQAGVQKPDPRPLLLTMARAGVAVDRTLFVGDSLIDLQTARAAAVPIVGVSFGYASTPLDPADFDGFIDRFEDLPSMAARLLAGGG